MKKLIIVGASGHGKVVADIAIKNGYSEIAFLDDDDSVKSCMGIPVLGRTYEANKYIDSDFIVAIGNAEIREKIQKNLEDVNLKVVTLVHPEAVIAPTVCIGTGTVVMAGAVINPDTKIGKGCIINTGASVDHDNQLDDYVHISVGCHLAGTVTVGKGTWVGTGAVVSNNVKIREGCMIGAGAVVVNDIIERGTYIGVPARWIK